MMTIEQLTTLLDTQKSQYLATSEQLSQLKGSIATIEHILSFKDEVPVEVPVTSTHTPEA